ncbi:MAG TPA: FAD-dependent oxidoreductase [Vicinamibacteria bacterium]|nr:FAD-dependent oxidoreductase [Vicinamibacteria bacterium]
MSATVDRRQLLKTMGTAAAGFAAGCATGGRRAAFLDVPRRFARVRVAPDRVIRTVAGLRPYRPSGFVVRAEKLDGRLVVHHYGHGGAGVSLSWGTAALAVEEAAPSGARRYAVLGCGAVGLATARLLQRRGHDVVIYARDLPPNTTSNVAGAEWGTFSVAEPSRRTPAFAEQLVRAARLSHRMFQDLVGERYGVRWLDAYELAGAAPAARRGDAVSEALAELQTASHELARNEHPFDRPYARQFTTMLIEPPVYLEALLADFRLAGGKVVVREFRDRRALLDLPEPVVVNCTGLGSRALFGDEEMVPAKGQLSVLVPQPEVDYAVLTDNLLYMFPRRDGILLGGTFERGEWSLTPDPAAAERILQGHMALFGRTG